MHNPLRISHHTHDILNVFIGLRTKKTGADLGCHPEEALLSFPIFRELTVEQTGQKYFNFYQMLLEMPGCAIVFDFDAVTKDFNRVVGAINAATGRNIPLSTDLASGTARVLAAAKGRAIWRQSHRARRRSN